MIDFFDAYNGGVRMYADGALKGWGKTAEGGAYTLTTCGIAETTYGSSTMDFAAEEGFDTDDGAMLLLKRAFELI